MTPASANASPAMSPASRSVCPDMRQHSEVGEHVASRVHRDHRDAGVNRRLDRGPERVGVGDRYDQAVWLTGDCGVDDLAHGDHVEGTWRLVVGRHAHVLGGGSHPVGRHRPEGVGGLAVCHHLEGVVALGHPTSLPRCSRCRRRSCRSPPSAAVVAVPPSPAVVAVPPSPPQAARTTKITPVNASHDFRVTSSSFCFTWVCWDPLSRPVTRATPLSRTGPPATAYSRRRRRHGSAARLWFGSDYYILLEDVPTVVAGLLEGGDHGDQVHVTPAEGSVETLGHGAMVGRLAPPAPVPPKRHRRP